MIDRNRLINMLREHISREKNSKIFSFAIGILLIPVAILFFASYGENYSLRYEESVQGNGEETIQENEEERASDEIEGNLNEDLEEEASGLIFCDISGEVLNPGVYTLSEGSRLVDLIDAAGGLTENGDIDRINRAGLLTDGEKIYVPRIGESEGLPPIFNSSLATSNNQEKSGKININTASSEELQNLPGIGPAMSERIISYRKTEGGFSSIEELKNVSGIGEKTFEKLKEKVTV